MATPESLVRRKAALRAAQRRKRRHAAATAGTMAAEASADVVVRGFRLPPARLVSGCWPLADELDRRPRIHRLARRAAALEARQA